MDSKQQTHRIVARWALRRAVQEVCASPDFHVRTASLVGFTPEVVTAFADSFILPVIDFHDRTALFGGLTRRLSQFVEMLRKDPALWEKIKEFLGIKNLLDIPRAIKKWAQEGFQAIRNVFKKLTHEFPLALFFTVPKAMPTITDAVNRIMAKSPFIQRAVKSIQGAAVKIDQLLDRALPTFRRPILAAIFIWFWMNIAELSFDLPGTIEGFLGGVTLGQLFNELPENGLSFLAGMFGLGYEFLPLVIIARVAWLVSKRYMKWVPGKGLIVDWGAVTAGAERSQEFVSVF
jgi:hypothetical protein